MTDSDDYYEILGVSRDADDEEIKKAFKQRALEYHPDRSDDPEAEEKFKKISEAYEVLSDDEQRSRYDRFGKQGVQGAASRGRSYRSADIGDIFEGMGFGDLFSQFFGGGGRRGRRRSRRGSDLRMRLDLDLQEAAFGCQKEVELRKREECDVCGGSGAKDSASKKTCPDCEGRGKVSTSRGFFTLTETCSRCKGRGQVITDPCEKCNGAGKIRRTKTLEVDVPAGVETGHRIRIDGEGEAGEAGSGNLYVEINVSSHQRFKRDGADLYTQVPISFVQAALGGEVEVPLLEDDEVEELEVDQGTQTGEVFVLNGRGAHHLNRPGRGDLHVQVKVITPTNLSEEEEELFEQLAEIRGEEVQPRDRTIFEKVRDVFTG